MLEYWEKDGPAPDAYSQLKQIRLKSIVEAFPLSLPHNRPKGTALITVSRYRTDKGYYTEKTVWEKGMDYPANVVVRPKRVKR